ncbi:MULTISPECIES: spore coat protein U domain-containing protein [Pseudomonas]|uniref:Spore coat protein U domain-containing protein n=1 Tax=Pseudomonas sessilinigenes TaxID=658629 RepID=A0ABX8MX27_9PSED|nr:MULTISPECIES: spore coat protein U domain-containing protein [Pseudomonas]QIH11940.1 fimbrial major subunit CsuA/B family protein [Pseudomonas sp. BIOMIG1BAC]QXH43775.1 spore coat protein U domain-containing protein [Pseudomonas sessilinigenes]UMZ15343.1 spore coat protein U domain-containing protein [Pseudomonas sp. MPFS]
MHAFVSRLGLTLLGLILFNQAQAATTVTGQISASLILTSSCLVNGVGGTTGLNFGALNFGTTNSLFTEADAQVLQGGGGALSIQCSSGTSPTLKIAAGINDGKSTGGTRALYDGVANYVPYDLYTDSAHTQLVAINGVINLGASTGAAQSVNLYGKATGKAGLPAGTYTDTVSVVLSF